MPKHPSLIPIPEINLCESCFEPDNQCWCRGAPLIPSDKDPDHFQSSIKVRRMFLETHLKHSRLSGFDPEYIANQLNSIYQAVDLLCELGHINLNERIGQ